MTEEPTTTDPAGPRRPASPRPARRQVPAGRRLAVGIAAAVLTLGSAAAAVALNLGASDPATGSPAGKLVATTMAEAPTSAPTPSTIVVDVTVPDLPPGSVPQVETTAPLGSTAGGGGSPSGTVATDPAATSVARTDDDHGTEVGDDHGGDRTDDRSDDAGEHHEGADDDD